MAIRAATLLGFAFVALAAASGEETRQPSSQDLARLAARYHELGVRSHDLGNYGDAELLYVRSIQTWEKTFGPEHPGLVRLLNTLAALHLDAKQYGKAEEVAQRSLRILRATPGVMPATDEATALIHLGSAHRALRAFDASEAEYLRAEEILRREPGPDNGELANVWNSLGALYADRGMPERAASYLERSLEGRGGGCSQAVAMTTTNLAAIAGRSGNPEEAEKAYGRAIGCARQAFGQEHPQTAEILSAYAAFLRKANRKREAARVDAEANDIRAQAARSDGSRYIVDVKDLRAAGRKGR